MGQLQVAPQLFLVDRLFVQAGVFQGDGCLVGDAPEEAEVVLGELFAAILRVELDDAEGLAVGGAKRHAHDGADAEIDDALAELDALVAGGVAAKEGLVLSRHLRTMLLLKRAVVSSPARRLDQPRDQLLAVVLREDEETAVGLPEQVKQAVADLGEQKVQLQRLAEAAADLQQAAQPLGRLVLEDHVAAG